MEKSPRSMSLVLETGRAATHRPGIQQVTGAESSEPEPTSPSWHCRFIPYGRRPDSVLDVRCMKKVFVVECLVRRLASGQPGPNYTGGVSNTGQ